MLQGTINGDLIMPKSVESTVTVPIVIPDDTMDRLVDFYIYSDGVLLSKKGVVPASDGGFSIEVTGSGIGKVSVMVDTGYGEQLYLEYAIDYDTATVGILSGPNTGLLTEIEAPVESEAESSEME